MFLSGGLWFAFGSRLSLSEEERENDILNLAVYYLGTLPVSFVLIFFGLGGL